MISAKRRVILVRSAADSCKPEARGFLRGRPGATLYNIRSEYGGRQPAGKIPDSMAMGPRPGLGEGRFSYGIVRGAKSGRKSFCRQGRWKCGINLDNIYY